MAEAEDVVQEALLRVHRVRETGKAIDSPVAYVTTISTRLAIDHLRSARVRREQYMGDWLPEPLVESPEGDPGAARRDGSTRSRSLPGRARAPLAGATGGLLLRDVFGYGYDEIAEILDLKTPNVRQLAVRARRHVRDERPRFAVSRRQQQRLASSFFAAVERGDVRALESVLAEDVVLRATAAAKHPRLGTRSWAAPMLPARCWPGRDSVGTLAARFSR